MEFDFETLYEAQAMSAAWRAHLNEKTILHNLSVRYGLQEVDSFEELAQAYDKENITKRCLEHHAPDLCMLYFARQGNVEGLVLSLVKGASAWLAATKLICEYKHYHMLNLFLRLAPIDEEEHIIYAACKVYLQKPDSLLLACLKQNEIYNLRVCFIIACELGDFAVVTACLRKNPTLYEEGLIRAIEKEHVDLVRFLVGMGARVTEKVRRVAHAQKEPTILKMILAKR